MSLRLLRCLNSVLFCLRGREIAIHPERFNVDTSGHFGHRRIERSAELHGQGGSIVIRVIRPVDFRSIDFADGFNGAVVGRTTAGYIVVFLGERAVAVAFVACDACMNFPFSAKGRVVSRQHKNSRGCEQKPDKK